MPAESCLQGAQMFEADGVTDGPDSEPDLLGVQPPEAARCADAHRMAVSYTHLDVDKRQIMSWARVSPTLTVFRGGLREKITTA